MRCSTRFIAATAVAAVSLLPVIAAGGAAGSQPSLPPALASFLTEEAHATLPDRETLLAGSPLVKLLDADPAKEIAVFGAIWVNAPRSLYVQQVKNIEQFERGSGFRITKRISDPPRADDFAALTISDEDFEDLKNCKIGDCVLKLDADGVQALRAEMDWRKPTAKSDATALLRRLALDYVNRYREGGNAGLGIHRDRERPTFVGNEFRSMIERLPRLGAELPDLTRYLLDYPNATLKNSTDFLYWQETQFGLRPTIRMSHLVIQDAPGQTVVASKMLYASHYFWTALELRVLLPDPARGAGFWLVSVNRSRSDGLSGFTGRVIRSRVRSEVENGTRRALTATKARLEALRTRSNATSSAGPASSGSAQRGQHMTARESVTRTERVPSFRHRISARRRPSADQRTDSKADPLSTGRDSKAFVLRHATWRLGRRCRCEVRSAGEAAMTKVILRRVRAAKLPAESQ